MWNLDLSELFPRIVRLSHCRLIDKHYVCGFDLLSVGIRTTVHTRWPQSMGAKKYYHHTTPSISYTTTFLPSELTETFSRIIIDGMTTDPNVLSHLTIYLDHQYGNDPRVCASSYFGNRRKRCRFGTPPKKIVIIREHILQLKRCCWQVVC